MQQKSFRNRYTILLKNDNVIVAARNLLYRISKRSLAGMFFLVMAVMTIFGTIIHYFLPVPP